MGGRHKDSDVLDAAVVRAWQELAPVRANAELWRELRVHVERATGIPCAGTGLQRRAQRLGLRAQRYSDGLASLRVTERAAQCPHCPVELALDASLTAAGLVAFARTHNACRRAYSARLANGG